jgi:hypothetical protein
VSFLLIFYWASHGFRLCVKIIVTVHQAGNSAQMSFPRAHTKCRNQGRTNAFSTCANEHYAVNLYGVNAQLRAQSCPRNQNTGIAWLRLLLNQLSLFSYYSWNNAAIIHSEIFEIKKTSYTHQYSTNNDMINSIAQKCQH